MKVLAILWKGAGSCVSYGMNAYLACTSSCRCPFKIDVCEVRAAGSRAHRGRVTTARAPQQGNHMDLFWTPEIMTTKQVQKRPSARPKIRLENSRGCERGIRHLIWILKKRHLQKSERNFSAKSPGEFSRGIFVDFLPFEKKKTREAKNIHPKIHGNIQIRKSC